jgi:hypothetical protein
MPPGLVGVGRGLWDSQETQAVGVTWGYLHPPGYPLQSLLANLLAHTLGALPGVEPAWGVTLLSVLALVLAVGFVYQVVRQLTGNYVAAVLAMAVFAFSPGPWRTAITPEVYALNLALWGLVFWLTTRAADVSSPRADFWLGLALGLAIGHHRTALLLVPAVVLYLGVRRGRSVAWGRLLVGMLLSAAVYLYLPLAELRHSPLAPGDPTSLGGFWELVSARVWSVFFHLPGSAGELSSRLELIFDALADQLGVVGTGLGLAGLAWLVWRQSASRPASAALVAGRLALLGLPTLGLLAFAVVYQVPDVATMLGPLVMILCIGLGGLVAGGWGLRIGSCLPAFGSSPPVPQGSPSVPETGTGSKIGTTGTGSPQPPPARAASRRPGRSPGSGQPGRAAPSLQLSALVLVVAVGGGLLVHNYSSLDESWDRRGQAVLAEMTCELRGMPGEVWLTAESGYAGPLVTYIAQRTGRPLVWANPWGKWDYLAALAQGRRVFLVKDMPGAWQYPDVLTRLAGPSRYLLPTGSPDLLELVDGSLSPPVGPDYVSLDQPFGSAIVLRGYALRRCQQDEGQVLRLTLYWEDLARLDQDWRVKAHLLGGDGTLMAQADNVHPAQGARPTTRWQPGEVVRDVHDFRLPPGTDLSGARVVVGLYQIVGDEFPSLAEVEIEIACPPARPVLGPRRDQGWVY